MSCQDVVSATQTELYYNIYDDPVCCSVGKGNTALSLGFLSPDKLSYGFFNVYHRGF